MKIKLQNFWKRATKYDTIQNRAMVWDLLKCELRGITIEYSIKKAKRTRQYVNELNEEFKKN